MHFRTLSKSMILKKNFLEKKQFLNNIFKNIQILDQFSYNASDFETRCVNVSDFELTLHILSNFEAKVEKLVRLWIEIVFRTAVLMRNWEKIEKKTVFESNFSHCVKFRIENFKSCQIYSQLFTSRQFSNRTSYSVSKLPSTFLPKVVYKLEFNAKRRGRNVHIEFYRKVISQKSKKSSCFFKTHVERSNKNSK